MRIRWAGHVACKVENKNVSGFWWEKMMERDNFEDTGVDGTKSKSIFKK